MKAVKCTLRAMALVSLAASALMSPRLLAQTPTTYKLTVSPTSQGKISSDDFQIDCTSGSSRCSATYNEDVMVILTVSPVSGFQVGSFDGCRAVDGSPNKCQAKMGHARTVTVTMVRAAMTAASWTLTVNARGGTVWTSDRAIYCTSSSCSKTYDDASPAPSGLTLSAIAPTGYKHTGWSTADGRNPCSSIASGYVCTVSQMTTTVIPTFVAVP